MRNPNKRKNIVGLKELRNNIESYIKDVDMGRSFIVVRRSQPVFKISPVGSEDGPWEKVVDFTAVNQKGLSGREVIKAIRATHG